MFGVTVRIPAHDVAMRMCEMRAWFDQQQCVPEIFAYGETTSDAVARFGFTLQSEAAAFSTRFAGHIIAP